MNETESPVSVCWSVSIDRAQLGTFISCEGLGVEVVLEQREEGGNNDFTWQIPTRLKYTNVKLTRPVCPQTSDVLAWLASMTGKVAPETATIQAMTAQGKVVAEWSLSGVIPVRWTGPSLSAESPKVAT